MPRRIWNDSVPPKVWNDHVPQKFWNDSVPQKVLTGLGTWKVDKISLLGFSTKFHRHETWRVDKNLRKRIKVKLHRPVGYRDVLKNHALDLPSIFIEKFSQNLKNIHAHTPKFRFSSWTNKKFHHSSVKSKKLEKHLHCALPVGFLCAKKENCALCSNFKIKIQFCSPNFISLAWNAKKLGAKVNCAPLHNPCGLPVNPLWTPCAPPVEHFQKTAVWPLCYLGLFKIALGYCSTWSKWYCSTRFKRYCSTLKENAEGILLHHLFLALLQGATFFSAGS